MMAVCSVCGKEFVITTKRYNEKIKKNERFYCSKECLEHKTSKKCFCANCNKEVWKTPSQLARSKSGNVFCSRSCSTSYNNKFKVGEKHPNFKGVNYREKAFEEYPHCCAVCGWNEDERILEVHHIDECHSNNDIKNLILLCPTCHRKITLGYYILVNRKRLLPK